MIHSKSKQSLISLGLLWAFSISVLRAVRWPNDWAEAHWLINYQFGFLKRALPGTLLSPFINANNSSGYAELLIKLVSSFFFFIFCAGLIWACLRIMKNNRFDINSLLVVLLFLTSPYIVMSAHLNGYYDNITITITILSCVLVMRGKLWPASILLSLGMLVHESILLIGFPSVLFLALIRHSREIIHSDAKKLFKGFLAEYYLLVILPLLTFGLIIINQAALINSPAVKNRLMTYLSQFTFIQFNRDDLVSTALTKSFFDYLTDQGPQFFYRITRPVYFIHTVLPLLILLSYSWYNLRGIRFKKLIFGILGVITLLPLSFHMVACDTSRIWTYPIIVAMLGVYGINEVFSTLKAEEKTSFLFCINTIMIIVVQLFIVTPLLDAQCERFSNVQRILFYAPSLVLITSMVSRHYCLSRRSD